MQGWVFSTLANDDLSRSEFHFLHWLTRCFWESNKHHIMGITCPHYEPQTTGIPTHTPFACSSYVPAFGHHQDIFYLISMYEEKKTQIIYGIEDSISSVRVWFLKYNRAVKRVEVPSSEFWFATHFQRLHGPLLGPDPQDGENRRTPHYELLCFSLSNLFISDTVYTELPVWTQYEAEICICEGPNEDHISQTGLLHPLIGQIWCISMELMMFINVSSDTVRRNQVATSMSKLLCAKGEFFISSLINLIVFANFGQW